jgi:hypothetical protein
MRGIMSGIMRGINRGINGGNMRGVMRVVMRGVLRGVMRELVRTEVIFQSCFALLITHTIAPVSQKDESLVIYLSLVRVQTFRESHTEEKVCEMIDQH